MPTDQNGEYALAQVQARFYVEGFARSARFEGASVTLSAVCRGPENSTWSKYTPTGKVEMTVTNPTAATWFEEHLGKEVAITFTDRPPVCDVCHQEIPDGQGTYTHDAPANEGMGKFVHATCK